MFLYCSMRFLHALTLGRNDNGGQFTLGRNDSYFIVILRRANFDGLPKDL